MIPEISALLKKACHTPEKRGIFLMTCPDQMVHHRCIHLYVEGEFKMSVLFLLLGISLLIVHEMDAVRNAEWNLIAFLPENHEENGYRWFAGLHIPLLALLLWGVFVTADPVRHAVRIGFDFFLIGHLLLHLVFSRHPRNRFTSAFSKGVMILAAVCGAADLGAIWRIW